jgi:hypothetical protein
MSKSLISRQKSDRHEMGVPAYRQHWAIREIERFETVFWGIEVGPLLAGR